MNTFLANFPILYPLKTGENLWFSDTFKEYKIGTLASSSIRWAELPLNKIRGLYQNTVT